MTDLSKEKKCQCRRKLLIIHSIKAFLEWWKPEKLCWTMFLKCTIIQWGLEEEMELVILEQSEFEVEEKYCSLSWVFKGNPFFKKYCRTKIWRKNYNQNFSRNIGFNQKLANFLGKFRLNRFFEDPVRKRNLTFSCEILIHKQQTLNRNGFGRTKPVYLRGASLKIDKRSIIKALFSTLRQSKRFAKKTQNLFFQC